MSFKSNIGELKDWLGYQRRESNMRVKLIRKHLKRENERLEYYNFKKVVFQQIDEMLYSGEYSKVVLKPLPKKDHYFELILEDEDFSRFYNGRFTASGELEVSIKKFD